MSPETPQSLVLFRLARIEQRHFGGIVQC